MNLTNFLDLVSYSRQTINFREKLISTVGGFLGIFGIFITSYWLFDPEVAVYIVPSMGASAVLLFAAPHAPFSQPWNVITGHAFSAFIGVACWHWIPDYTVAASASIGLAITAMVFTRSIYPPGWRDCLTILAQRILINDTHAPGGKLNEQIRQLAGPRTFTV